jgi:hypothetical protein
MKKYTPIFIFLLLATPPVSGQYYSDPEGVQDSVYIVCANPYLNSTTGNSEVSLQLRYFSDNTGTNKPQAVGATLRITGDNITAVDTTVAHFTILSVSKDANPNPTIPPFFMGYAAVNFSGGVTGDSLLVNIVLTVNDTGLISVDTFSPATMPLSPIEFVTENAQGYGARWTGPHQCQVIFSIPTFTQWGMLAFALLLLGVLTFYLLKYRRLKPAN